MFLSYVYLKPFYYFQLFFPTLKTIRYYRTGFLLSEVLKMLHTVSQSLRDEQNLICKFK
jgi:hypothetical protein